MDGACALLGFGMAGAELPKEDARREVLFPEPTE